MNWLSVLREIGLFGVGSGLLAWLFRSLIKQALARDLAAFTHGLRAAHEIQIEEAKQRLTVGATSHMADVAFDKYAEFCERYVDEAQRTLGTLIQEGPTVEVLPHANSLGQIRLKSTVWLTLEMESRLMRFEAGIRELAIRKSQIDRGPEWSAQNAIEKLFALTVELQGDAEWNGKILPSDRAIPSVIQALREVLGVAELTRLRTELIKRALGETAS